jgi:hypothetical protein
MKPKTKQMMRILATAILISGFCLAAQGNDIRNIGHKRTDATTVKAKAPTNTPGPIADDTPIDPKSGSKNNDPKKHDGSKPLPKKRSP